MNLPLYALQAAAWLHLCQIPGMWVVSRGIIDTGRELRRLSPLAAAVVRVMALAVLVLLVTIGSLVACHPEDVLSTALGRALAAFLGVFWAARGLVQLWYYARLAWPRTRVGRLSHAALVSIFALQAAGYLTAWTLSAPEPEAASAREARR